jgi:hypothetical protein
MYKRLSSKVVLFFVGATLLVALGVVLAKVAGGDDPQLPIPTTALPDAQTVYANATISAGDEQSDQQALQDARNGLYGPVQPKDGGFQPSDIPNVPDTLLINGIINHPVPEAGWGALYHISNGWTGLVGGPQLLVTAGSKVDNYELGIWNTPEQGMVVMDGNAANLFGEYLTPTRTGAVRITSFSGSCLALLSTNNTSYHFDMATRAWSCNVNQGAGTFEVDPDNENTGTHAIFSFRPKGI